MVVAAKKLCAGLDIGSHSVKLVVLSHGREKPELESYGVVECSSDSDSHALEQSVRALFVRCRAGDASVVTALPGHSLVVRYLELPRMSGEETAVAAREQASNQIPFGIDQAVFDFHILNASATSQAERMKVLLVAARKELVERHLELMDAGGVSPDVIDVDSFALVNCFESSGTALGEQEPVVLLNVGGEMTSINVLLDGRPCFTREIALAGRKFTEAIQRKLGITSREAEKMKREEGDALGSSPASNALRPVLDDLAGEVRLSFDYLASLVPGRRVKRVFLSGGSARLRNLREFLERSLGMAVEVWNALAGLNWDGHQSKASELRASSCALAVGIGLALRGEAGW